MHTWGTIPVNSEHAQQKMQDKSASGDVDVLFLNALGMRWLILDEISTVSPALLGLLDSYLRRACLRHPYAKRDGHQRPFGGINFVFAGDFWQLGPVKASAIFANPFAAGHSFHEQKMLKMFWKRNDIDSIQQTFVLEKPMRSDDPWLLAVLHADRYGQESWEMYCFIHGLPTRNPGTWLPDRCEPVCGNEICKRLATELWPQMWENSRGEMWSWRSRMECDKCAAERERRCCVIRPTADSLRRYTEDPFANAPFVHPFRHPA